MSKLFWGIIFCALCIVSTASAQVKPGTFKVWDDPKNPLRNRFTSHKEGEQHYDSLTLYLYQKEIKFGQQDAALKACLAANPEFDPACKPIQSGELYKPVSETHGAPALLVSNSFEGQTAYITDSGGKKVGTLIRTSCCANGNRNHFFFRERCETLPSPIYIRLSGGACRVVKKPCDRI